MSLVIGSLLLLVLTAVSQTAIAGNPLRYAEDRSPAIVNPLFATTMSEARLNELVFEGLFSDDLELRSAPRLAERWELADDNKSIVIYLRHGVKWHDGNPFRAEDVAFSINAMKNRATASTEAGRAAWIKSVQVVDDVTVTLTFNDPEYAPEDKLHFKILPAHKFDSDTVSRTDPFRNQPIGTGPYAVTSFNDDNSITMDKWADYWGESHLDKTVMREVADH
ncbi:MAG: hypothetical protein HN348_16245, partial [Proteobacteria bacterium]|nr:hypothetical protein [Pseudomonadota bacterium]